jgi:Tfp pilus assembly protein PilF
MNLITHQPFPYPTQKIILKNTFRWSATVCFAGIGLTNKLIVGEWLAERMNAIEPNDPFERLLDELLTAQNWLSAAVGDKRHSFSVGAFVGSEPLFALVSNFEQLSGYRAETADPKLSVYLTRPQQPRTFVAGSGRAWTTRPERKRLAALAARDPEPQRMYSALAELNREVASRDPRKSVSSACFTGHVRFTGEGGGEEQNVSGRWFVPSSSITPELAPGMMQILDEQFGPGRHRVRAVSFVRAEDSDEYYETQLSEKPNDAETHSNYGHFLKEQKKDLVGAQREFRRAIELEPRHAMALSNLGFLLWEQGNKDEAEDLFRSALDVDPGHELALLNYAIFLLRERDDPRASSLVLDSGIAHNPDSGRLLLLRAHLSLTSGSASEALELLRRAREKGADQAAVEADYAFAIQLSGASVGECIAAYLTAIALNPTSGDLRLNLAQLMFIKGDGTEANKQLQKAIRLALAESTQLEAQFYLLAHVASEPSEILRTTKALLARGARLSWDVNPNIERVRQYDPEKAGLLELVRQVITGEQEGALLDGVLARWPQKRI